MTATLFNLNSGGRSNPLMNAKRTTYFAVERTLRTKQLRSKASDDCILRKDITRSFELYISLNIFCNKVQELYDNRIWRELHNYSLCWKGQNTRKLAPIWSHMNYFWIIFQSKFYALHGFLCMDLQSEIYMYHISIVI